MSPVTVYGINLSPPTRAVLLTLEALKVPYDFSVINLFEGENKSPEFLRLNPQHSVPVYKEGNFVLTESRSILTYLATKHKNTRLYPTGDLKTRAIIDARLNFDMGTLYGRFGGQVLFPIMLKGEKPSEQSMEGTKEALGWLNDFVKKTGFAAGTPHATLADLSLAVSFATLQATGLFDLSEFPDLEPWLERVRVATGEAAWGKAVEEGTEVFRGIFQQRWENAN